MKNAMEYWNYGYDWSQIYKSNLNITCWYAVKQIDQTKPNQTKLFFTLFLLYFSLIMFMFQFLSQKGQSEPGSNVNEGLLHTHQRSDAVKCHTKDIYF